MISEIYNICFKGPLILILFKNLHMMEVFLKYYQDCYKTLSVGSDPKNTFIFFGIYFSLFILMIASYRFKFFQMLFIITSLMFSFKNNILELISTEFGIKIPNTSEIVTVGILFIVSLVLCFICQTAMYVAAYIYYWAIVNAFIQWSQENNNNLFSLYVNYPRTTLIILLILSYFLRNIIMTFIINFVTNLFAVCITEITFNKNWGFRDLGLALNSTKESLDTKSLDFLIMFTVIITLLGILRRLIHKSGFSSLRK